MTYEEQLKRLNIVLSSAVAVLSGAMFFMILLYFVSSYIDKNKSNTELTVISQVVEKTEEQKRFDFIEKCYDKTINFTSDRTARSFIEIRNHCIEFSNIFFSRDNTQSIK